METSNGKTAVYTQTVESSEQSIQQKEEEASRDAIIRVYKRRWLMLFLFCLVSMSNALQWIQYSVISNVVKDFYGISQMAVDWFSMIFMLVYIPLIFPGTWLLDHAGLRVIGICAASLNCLGAWLKYAGAQPHLFWLGFTGQTIAAIAQIFILGMPAHVAATWFGAEQVSTACSLGVFGNQIGIALGFVLPPILVPNDDNVQSSMQTMFLGTAILTTILFLLVLVLYRERPPHPPSRAKFEGQRSLADKSYMDSIWALARNHGFVLLVISYGINVGVFYAISTLLNLIVLSEFPNKELEVGIIGLLLVLAGIVGSIATGVWLDKTRTYRGTTVVVYCLSFLGMILFTSSLKWNQIWVVGAVAAFLGFFMTGYLPLGFEYGAELTHPEPEANSSGLLNASAQAFGIPFTIFTGMIVEASGAVAGNLFLCGTLFIGIIMTACIKSDLRRQKAEMQELKNEEDHTALRKGDPE